MSVVAATMSLPIIALAQQAPVTPVPPTPIPMIESSPAPQTTSTPAISPSPVTPQPGASASPTPNVSASAKANATPAATPVIHRTPKALVALPAYDEVTSTRLQIFLDNHNFGPGKIDGKMGEFFRKALVAYKIAHGMYPTGSVDRLLNEVPEPFTTYTIRPEDEKFIGEVSNKPSEQAKLKALLYGSLLEFVAERFHAAEDYIVKLNPGKDMEKLKVGDTVKVPNVQPFKIETLSEGFVPPNAALSKRVIIIDTHERTLEVRDEHNYLLYEFPITPGSTKLPAPKGTWKILGIAKMPWFRHDEGVLNHGVRTNDFYNLPPGPNNPVGILWMGLNKPGIGIHGTNNPETIGRAGSHGCIRMANWDANKIKDLVTVGTVVKIY
jgi:lipoprotein-anchoring transpeptidase ErfK/SrfK